MNKENIEKVTLMAHRMRRRSLKMALDCDRNGSHLGAALSTIEIFASLYGQVLKFNVNDPLDQNRDRLVVSKGHCVLAYYTALNEVGFLSDADLESFEKNGSRLHGHATRDLATGIEFSGGSLGMGLSYAVGVAVAGKANHLSYHVYALIGDGECNEGIVWESFMAASHYGLDNLTVIVDDNKLQYDGESTKVMNMGSLRKKFEAFGFYTHDIDGHNVEQVIHALTDHEAGKPTIIIANTIKGKGVSFMEGKKEWHHSRLSPEQYEIAIAEQPVI
ncbi:MAG: transketolase [Sediminibacterium sp.]